MAYPSEGRSMNAELSEGTTDGKYKKIDSRERGGIIEGSTWEARKDLDDEYYGFHEINPKVAPDGLLHSTPTSGTAPEADSTKW